jgi:Esterase-like activity of phytase
MRTRALLATTVPFALALVPAVALAHPGHPGHPGGHQPSHHGHPHGPSDPADAVTLFKTQLPPLASIGGVPITGGAYGSSLTAKPGSDKVFYGLTDRGPNADGPNGSKVEPLPDFQPAIGEFVLQGDGTARLVRRIGLSAFDGKPYNGQVNPDNTTSETITDLDGNILPASFEGYDPEGLVVMKDGTFWVSDEYGPFITHFSKDGRAIERLSPNDGTLPRELIEREPNKGMEGLTITPDGRTLVGIMQAGLDAPDGPKSKNVTALRIVTVDLRTHASHEYVYLLHNDGAPTTAVSEIAAVNDHQFLVDERDGNVEPAANKKLFLVDLRGATDVGPSSKVPGSTYDGPAGGLMVASGTVEHLVGTDNTADAATALQGAGITPVSSSLFLDIGGLVTAIDPTGGFFGHDKVEGVAVLDAGKRVVLSNDNDFGIDGLANDAPPFQLHAKILPNGTQDDGEYLEVDLSRVPAAFR